MGMRTAKSDPPPNGVIGLCGPAVVRAVRRGVVGTNPLLSEGSVTEPWLGCHGGRMLHI